MKKPLICYISPLFKLRHNFLCFLDAYSGWIAFYKRVFIFRLYLFTFKHLFNYNCIDGMLCKHGSHMEVRGQLGEVESALLLCGTWGWTQVDRLGDKHLYSLSHLTNPKFIHFLNHNILEFCRYIQVPVEFFTDQYW